jgi:hypothetical protein
MKKATGERQPSSKKRDISQTKEKSNIGRDSQYIAQLFLLACTRCLRNRIPRIAGNHRSRR